MRPCSETEKGQVCIFYTRREKRQVDPISLHFGAAVRNMGVEKWTCQRTSVDPSGPWLADEARQSDVNRKAFMQKVFPDSRYHPTRCCSGKKTHRQKLNEAAVAILSSQVRKWPLPGANDR